MIMCKFFKSIQSGSCVACQKFLKIFDEKHIQNIKDLLSFIVYTLYMFVALHKSSVISMQIINHIIDNIKILEPEIIRELLYLLLAIFIFDLLHLWLWTWLRKKFNDNRGLHLSVKAGLGDKSIEANINTMQNNNKNTIENDKN